MTLSAAAAADEGITAFDLLPIGISALALLVGVFNIWRSERLARQNATQRLWSDAIEAVLRIPIHPADESLRDKLATLRVRFTALADGLSKWKGLDRWLAVEHGLGAALGRHVQESALPNMTEEQYVATLTPYMNWSMRLSQNLRHMRNTGYSPKEIEQLRIGAIEGVRTVYERNGWGEPRFEADIGRLGDLMPRSPRTAVSPSRVWVAGVRSRP